MGTIDFNDLEKILKSILAELETAGLLKGLNINKQQLIQDVSFQLAGKINVADLKNNKEMQKMLGLAIIFRAVSPKFPEPELNYEKFFEEKNDRKEVKDDLKNELKKFFLAMNELTNNPKHKMTPKQIDEYAEKIAEKITNNYMLGDQNKIGMNQLFTDSISELYLRTLNGGDNPSIAGEINYPINGPIMGNLIGIPTQSVQSTAKDTRTFMSDQGSYNPDKENAASEATALLSAVSQGLSEVLNMNNTPRLTPSGSQSK
ncbi:MAG: hypothetical protein A3F13_07385 [Gammaproteobacteria bacterium RIFCSPHIGHO2_12_FULL_40_19]|nr:MAG: hypothetical protein A3F13_07385 [Gammaproteobacteria bacterium RIFCSPHIGHO2_12_FULL_40_19]